MMRHSFILFAGLLLVCAALHADTNTAALARAAVLENSVAYLRINRVSNGLAEELQSAQKALAATNPIAGTVLDLRFADGDDSAAAKAAADLFAQKKLPLAILVNGDTRDAAATLAASLREAHDGLVLGGATGPLQPDVAVTVNPADERQFIKDPYAPPDRSGTNAAAGTNENLATFIDHTSEADLVREKIKDGEQDEDSVPPHPAEPQKPYIRDPVLARAVDLIKALAVVRKTHA